MGTGRRLFDAYYCVDWSARNAPSPQAPCADAIWIGKRSSGPGEEPGETYCRTREAAVRHLRARLRGHVEQGRRVLVGWDFPFGYPAGYVDSLGLAGPDPPWRRLWNELRRLVRDDELNASNRFQVAADLNARCGPSAPGPLWGCPPRNEAPTLARTSPGFPYPAGPTLPLLPRALERLRLCDRRARGVQEVWKLLGSASVGSQALVGIPRVAALRDDPELAAVSQVWPFETSFVPEPVPGPGPYVLHTEVWPGLCRDRYDPALPIRDQAQVRAVAHWAEQLDAAGYLGTLFTRPAGLTDPEVRLCEQEEGWILGT